MLRGNSLCIVYTLMVCVTLTRENSRLPSKAISLVQNSSRLYVQLYVHLIYHMYIDSHGAGRVATHTEGSCLQNSNVDMSALRLLNHMTALHTDSHVWAMRQAHMKVLCVRMM